MKHYNKSKSMDMVNGPLLKNVMLFSIPLMCASMLQMLFNAADTMVVGKFAGEKALAGVGATGSLVFLQIALFNGLSTGTNVVVARLFGCRDEERISKAVHTAMTMAVVGGMFLMVFGMIMTKPLLRLMSTPEDIIDLSALYMRIYFAGVVFLVVYNFGAAVLRSKGDTTRPLYFMVISGALNVVLNLLFVIVFHWSVAGVAIATVISEGVSAALVVYTLIHESDATRLVLRRMRIDRGLAADIMKIGIPAGIQSMVYSLSNVVVQSSLNSFDSAIIVAGNSAGTNMESFVYIGMDAFSQAAITFTSQNIGAGRRRSVKKIMLLTMVLDAGSAALLGGLVWVFGPQILSLYTNSPEVIEVGMIRTSYLARFLALNGILDIFICSLRGMGYSTVPTITMLVGICGVRLSWLWLVFPRIREIWAIYICFPFSWAFTSVVLGIMWVVVYKRLIREKKDSEQALAS